MKRLKLRVFLFLVLRANITEYSQSNSSHVRLPHKWGNRFDRFYRPISLSVLLNCWCLPVNIPPASRSTISCDPQNWREAFPIKKQLSGRQKQGQSHQLVTGELQRNLDNSPRVATFAFLAITFNWFNDKKLPRNGVQISLRRSRKRPRRVCNVPCNIFMCLRV